MRKLYPFMALTFACSFSQAQSPVPLAIYTDALSRCEDRPVTFRIAGDTALSGFSWTVQPNRNYTAGSANGSEFTATFHSPSVYTITALATDTAQRTGSMVVNISRSAKAAFNASLTTAGYPTKLVLTNYSSNHTSNLWRFSDGSSETGNDASKWLPGSGSYSVDLIAYGPNGCNDTSSYSYYISDSSEITLPNIFTPNGDGVNDLYRPISRGINSLHARIYNREQLMIHSWDRVNGFWDGRTTAGEACTDGVYIVVVEAKGFDGKEYRLRSTITLIR